MLHGHDVHPGGRRRTREKCGSASSLRRARNTLNPRSHQPRKQDVPNQPPSSPALPRHEPDPDRLLLVSAAAAQQLELDALALAHLARERLEAVVVRLRDGPERDETVAGLNALRGRECSGGVRVSQARRVEWRVRGKVGDARQTLQAQRGRPTGRARTARQRSDRRPSPLLLRCSSPSRTLPAAPARSPGSPAGGRARCGPSRAPLRVPKASLAVSPSDPPERLQLKRRRRTVVPELEDAHAGGPDGEDVNVVAREAVERHER